MSPWRPCGPIARKPCWPPADARLIWFASSDASGQRESWRRFLHGSVQPLGDLLAGELAVKLDVPGLALKFDRLMASDLSGRARALGSMVQAGMSLDDARRLAGLG